jgi:hypothetical protein
MEKIEIIVKELENARRAYNPVKTADFIPIEEFTGEACDGDYAIVGGRKVSMRVYGEKIVEETEQ